MFLAMMENQRMACTRLNLVYCKAGSSLIRFG